MRKARSGFFAALWERLGRIPLLGAVLPEFTRFFVFELPRVAAPAPGDEGFAVRPIEADRLRDLAACRGMEDPAAGVRVMARRLDEGCLGVRLVREGRAAGYIWAKVGESVLEDRNRYRMRMGPGGAHLFDAYIRPDHRGKGLYPILLRAVQEDLARRGVERFYLDVFTGNAASMKAHAKAGARLLERVTFVSFLGWEFHFAYSARGWYWLLDPPWRRREFLSRVVAEDDRSGAPAPEGSAGRDSRRSVREPSCRAGGRLLRPRGEGTPVAGGKKEKKEWRGKERKAASISP